MRLEPRSEVSPVRFILAPVAAVIASLLLCSGLILWSGASVFEAYWMMLTGSIGSSFALAETLSRATPLIFTGLAAAVAFRARFWNIGAEGQLYAGALMVTFLGTGEINIHEGLLPQIRTENHGQNTAQMLLVTVSAIMEIVLATCAK